MLYHVSCTSQAGHDPYSLHSLEPKVVLSSFGFCSLHTLGELNQRLQDEEQDIPLEVHHLVYQ